MPAAPSPLCCCRLDPDTKLGGRQLHCFFIPLDATQCFPAHQKCLGTTEGAAGSEQARPVSVLFWGTWLSGQRVCCYSSNTRKQTHGDIYMKKKRWLISENSLILSLEEDNLPHICINIANVCTKLHCPVTRFGLRVWAQTPAVGKQEGATLSCCLTLISSFCLKSGGVLLFGLKSARKWFETLSRAWPFLSRTEMEEDDVW